MKKLICIWIYWKNRQQLKNLFVSNRPCRIRLTVIWLSKSHWLWLATSNSKAAITFDIPRFYSRFKIAKSSKSYTCPKSFCVLKFDQNITLNMQIIVKNYDKYYNILDEKVKNDQLHVKNIQKNSVVWVLQSSKLSKSYVTFKKLQKATPVN